MTKRRFVNILSSLLCCLGVWANDTVFVSGGLQHDGLLDWTPVMYHSNSYLDLSVHYLNDSNNAHFHSLRASTRLEMVQWPLPGYEGDFAGHGVGHLSIASTFDWGEITLGDVYDEFGSGLILNLYEDRSLGIDGSLRGGKVFLTPYQGIEFTMLGGKQRRYWNCYDDHAWGWNYAQNAVIGADLELSIEQWSKRMQEHDISLIIGGSWVSKYESFDTILTLVDNKIYMYNLPRWVGACDVRTELRVKGFDFLVEYAYKANDPTIGNNFSYRPGKALFVSTGYSRKGLSVLAQVKYADNMSFRSDRVYYGTSGRLNNTPVFAQQHTYALAGLYPYATQYNTGEWAFEAEICYTAPRKTKFGGKYGTTIRFDATHVRGLKAPGSWAPDMSKEGEYYTDINIELNKRLSKQWWLNAMVMYQAYNQEVLEGHGSIIRSGIFVADARVQLNNNVAMRAELQYLYTPDYDGQWIFALYELSLYKRWTLSGQWTYNLGGTELATHEHYYSAGLTFNYGAHRANLGYVKTQEGFHCSGGVCRFIPKMEGISASYTFTW